MARLRSRPDGILVSKETISDYQLQPRRPAAPAHPRPPHRPFRVVPFHVVGVVQEFPSAPQRLVHGRQPVLPAGGRPRGRAERRVRQGRRPGPATAARVAAGHPADGTLVKNITQQTQQTVSSITTVDLRGIADPRGLHDRRSPARRWGCSSRSRTSSAASEFATMAALGAPSARHRRVRLERGRAGADRGAALAAGLGLLLSRMLSRCSSTCSIPPRRLAVPWAISSSCWPARS